MFKGDIDARVPLQQRIARALVAHPKISALPYNSLLLVLAYRLRRGYVVRCLAGGTPLALASAPGSRNPSASLQPTASRRRDIYMSDGVKFI